MTMADPHGDWPRWAYVPGGGPPADMETLTRAKSSLPARFGECVPYDDPALRYGLALNDRGFFWESHEILEAVWKAAPQGCRDRILLRACIQVANANLKRKMDRPRAVRRLLIEALADIDEVLVRRDSGTSRGFAGSFVVTALRLAIIDVAAEAQPIEDTIASSKNMKQNACFVQFDGGHPR